jgi:hypothetical protein
MPLTKLSEERTFAAVGQFAPRQLEVAHSPELELPPPTTIELNVGADEGSPVWQTPDDLSTGQKATAAEKPCCAVDTVFLVCPKVCSALLQVLQ